MYRRKRRRIRRQLPLYAFLLAMLAFLLAFALPPDVPEEDGTEPLPVRSLSSVLPPERHGGEPGIPDAARR